MQAFISYSHKDAVALDRLHVHLANLQREGKIKTWYDRDILAGSDIEEEINQELENADLFLLLVSPDFIASNYCVEREMRRALERHDAGEARVVPIILEPCEWTEIAPLRRLKAIPTDGTPISEWANANNGYLNVVQELRRIIDSEELKSVEFSSLDNSATSTNTNVPRYRIQRDFDEIDRGVFRDAAFATIKDYFRRAIAEIDAVEGLRGRFVDRSTTSFGGTIINRGLHNGTAHITAHCSSAGSGMADIYFSFAENAAENTANGGFNVSSDEYEQFLAVSMSMFGDNPDRLNAEQAAEYLWNQFIERAGVAHA